MKPPKRRNIRVERTLPSTHLDDETGHLWAVSYADFLMVLLSFFIIFFSVAPEDKSVILEILSKVTSPNASSGRNPDSTRPTAATLATGSQPLPKELETQLQNQVPQLKVTVDKDKKSIYVLFPDDIYRNGDTKLTTVGADQLAQFLKLIEPYLGRMEVIFIGHTDSKPLRYARSEYLVNNFDLSSLRASQALKLALGLGLDRNHLFTLGSADHTRNSRTLTVLLKPAGILEL
ncbi:MAG: flagellar motor protein MotB [Bdellovibrionota bacterium]